MSEPTRGPAVGDFVEVTVAAWVLDVYEQDGTRFARVRFDGHPEIEEARCAVECVIVERAPAGMPS